MLQTRRGVQGQDQAEPTPWRLTIVGGGRDAWSVWRRGRWRTVCARGADLAWSSGPSTSPLGGGIVHRALIGLLETYASALRDGLSAVDEPTARSHYFERVAAAAEIRDALDQDDLGRAGGILNGERRAIGWGWFAGPSGDAAHEAFLELDAAVMEARLKDAPDADLDL